MAVPNLHIINVVNQLSNQSIVLTDIEWLQVETANSLIVLKSMGLSRRTSSAWQLLLISFFLDYLFDYFFSERQRWDSEKKSLTDKPLHLIRILTGKITPSSLWFGTLNKLYRTPIIRQFHQQ